MSEREAVAIMLRDAVNGSGMTQREIARRMGTTEARVSQILNSKANPTLRTLLRFADALDRRLVMELVHDQPSPTPPQLTETSLGDIGARVAERRQGSG